MKRVSQLAYRFILMLMIVFNENLILKWSSIYSALCSRDFWAYKAELNTLPVFVNPEIKLSEII